jgi:pantothenate synthetase
MFSFNYWPVIICPLVEVLFGEKDVELNLIKQMIRQMDKKTERIMVTFY